MSEAGKDRQLDVFQAAYADIPTRDQRDLMERPFFSLAKTPRLKPIEYAVAGVSVRVTPGGTGLATIWDADILIWLATQITEALDRGGEVSPVIRFHPYTLLRGIRRHTGGDQYKKLLDALRRLHSAGNGGSPTVEHIVPSSVDVNQHFVWENLTIACTECNRRKSDYYSSGLELLNPYSDDVEDLLAHYGPVVGWKTGHTRAEITVRRLALHDGSRLQLIMRKIEKIDQLNQIFERVAHETSEVMKELLREQIVSMKQVGAEYSAMVMSLCAHKDGDADRCACE